MAKKRVVKPRRNTQESSRTQRKTEDVKGRITGVKKHAQYVAEKADIEGGVRSSNTISSASLSKSMEKAWRDYLDYLSRGGEQLPEFEALRPFMGKRGHVTKRSTRSKKSREELEKAKKEIKTKHGSRPSKKGIEKEGEERRKKNEETIKKGAETHAKKKVEKAKEEKKRGRTFKNVAKKAAKDYADMVDVLKDATIAKIMAALGVGTDYIQMLLDKGLSVQQIKDFLTQMSMTIDDLPDEARELADQDRYWSNMAEIGAIANEGGIEFDDLSNMFRYMIDAALDGHDPEDAIDVIRTYAAHNNGRYPSFDHFAGQMLYYDDPYNITNAEELLDV